MAELQICLMGSFQVSWDFSPVPASAWRSPLAARLLKLALLRRPHPVTVADAARLLGVAPGTGLGPAVEGVRQVLRSGAALEIDDGGMISFRPGPNCWIDTDALVSHYEAGVAAAQCGDMLPAILSLQEADGLYQGDLLEELQEPWVLEPRLQLQRIYIEVLDRLAEGHAVLARYQDAVGFCHKALAHDPLRESTFQRMMVYYYYLGDLAGAAEAYQACREALAGAGRKVSAETVGLWDRLARCEIPGGPDPRVAAAAERSRDRRPKSIG